MAVHTDHQQTEAIAKRLARAEGHLRAVQGMVVEDRDCAEVLTQLAAVRGAIDRAARLLLADHMEHCLLAAGRNSDGPAAWHDFKRAMDRYWGAADG